MAPCLMRNTELFDLKEGRLLKVFPEHLSAIGAAMTYVLSTVVLAPVSDS